MNEPSVTVGVLQDVPAVAAAFHPNDVVHSVSGTLCDGTASAGAVVRSLWAMINLACDPRVQALLLLL